MLRVHAFRMALHLWCSGAPVTCDAIQTLRNLWANTISPPQPSVQILLELITTPSRSWNRACNQTCVLLGVELCRVKVVLAANLSCISTASAAPTTNSGLVLKLFVVQVVKPASALYNLLL